MSMKFFYPLFIVLVISSLPTEIIASSEPSEKRRLTKNLMYDLNINLSEEWREQYLSYLEEKGRKKQKIEGSYTSSKVRLVQNIEALNIEYGILSKGENCSKAILGLPNDIMDICELGRTVKILNGYLQDWDNNKKILSFTPNQTNVLIPHISFIIQWQNNKNPELASADGWVDSSGKRIVFLSGTFSSWDKERIESFYNHIYKKPIEQDITIYSANEVGNEYMPKVLKNLIEEKKLKIFTDEFLLKEVVSSCIYKLNSLSKRYEDIELAGGGLSKAREQKDLGTTLEQINTLKTKLKTKLENDEDIEDKTLEEALEFFKRRTRYLKYTLNPNKFTNEEKIIKFWDNIKQFDKEGSTEDGSVTQILLSSTGERLDTTLSQYLIKEVSGVQHTEPLFMQFTKANPSSLTDFLDSLLASKKAQNNFKPKILGVMVDAYSWLDVCIKCSENHLSTSPLWQNVLEDIQPLLKEKGFSLPLLPLPSVFRIHSEKNYDSANYITSSEGKGDYSILNELKYALAIRVDSKKAQLSRDQILLRIPESLMSAAVAQPFSFWCQKKNRSMAKLIFEGKRQVLKDVMQIIFLKFPNERVLNIKKAQLLRQENNKENNKEAFNLLAPYVLDNVSFSKEERNFMHTAGFENRWYIDHKYLKWFFGKICLAIVSVEMEQNNMEEARKYIMKYAGYGLVYKESENIDDLELAQKRIYNYRAQKKINPPKEEGYSWEFSIIRNDQANLETSITLLSNFIRHD